MRKKPLLKRYRYFEVTCYSVWAGTLLSLVFLPGLPVAMRMASERATVAVAFLGLFSSALAYAAWALVLSRMPAARATSLFYAVPVLEVGVGWLSLGEIPTSGTILGGGLACVGVLLVRMSKADQR